MPGRLVQSVQRLVERIDTIGLRRINKFNRMVVVDDIQEGVVQEHILHIKLIKG
jgi:hypothetical protein